MKASPKSKKITLPQHTEITQEKARTYKIVILLVLLHRCETFYLTLREEHRVCECLVAERSTYTSALKLGNERKLERID